MGFFLVSNQLLRCKPIQTTSMHVDTPTTTGIPQVAVQRNWTETKGRSLQVFVTQNYQKVGMKYSKVLSALS